MSAAHRPRHVLVTGGAGFIGANLVRHLLATDPSLAVVTLDLMTYAADATRLEGMAGADRHTLVVGDICDAALVEELFSAHRFDTVLHLAAESHVDRSIAGPEAFVRTNVTGTLTLLEAARRWWLERPGAPESVRFHHVSTDEVFGALGPEDPPFRETTPYAPSSPYSASKAASDHLVRAWARTYGLPTTLSNCSNNYGRFQHAEKFIPTVIRACLADRPIPVYGTGRNVRDWLHVQDHCEALDRVVRFGRTGETYCVGGENERTNLEIVGLVCGLMDELRPTSAPHDRLIRFVSDRPGHDWRYAVSTDKVRRELDWRPRHEFRAGLAETIGWYARSGAAP
jgi:dTDP-glucose 4,6-dehydratase